MGDTVVVCRLSATLSTDRMRLFVKIGVFQRTGKIFLSNSIHWFPIIMSSSYDGSKDSDERYVETTLQSKTYLKKKKKVNVHVSISLSNTPSQKRQGRLTFQLALPPSKHHRRLRFSPTLILQVQQVSPRSHPIPVLDIFQPSLFMDGKFRDFPKPSARDIYITQREPYSQLTNEAERESENPSRSQRGELKEKEKVVAVICRTTKSEQPNASSSEADVHFRQGQLWKATTLPSNGYQFVEIGSNGAHRVGRWERGQKRVPSNHAGRQTAPMMDLPADEAAAG